ncbi:DUF6607 family protein [Aquimarina sp. MMG016]|uniref:DUF6607 family protein n=1 Tax=Aquimarina sp. MMG016 TaxID=2822690 RepID=UPI001B3A70F3|nr:DUF6607 family protein [Aquimarina sp. MMG016]MBQ4821701.1 hypothetical protein [Aquimarina sp. MMG016]
MKIEKVIVGLLALISFSTSAQKDKKKQDVEAIKSMCGCYEVTFKYSETFSPKEDYIKSKDYATGGLEWAELIEDKEDKLSIQHLLIVRDSMIVKHWRQDWLYENTDVHHYHKDNVWKYTSLMPEDVKGQWTQKVYQVDDSPRYSGSATWVHVDGRHYWENKTDAPLPRREYTKRSDYNVMVRGNRHEITDYGWIHEQDNDKVIRKNGGEDILLAKEKGYNIYTKVADEKCQLARIWWQDNQKFWASVREEWDDIYNRNTDLSLKKSVDEKPLYKFLFGMDIKTKQKDISEVVAKFIEE